MRDTEFRKVSAQDARPHGLLEGEESGAVGERANSTSL